MIYVCDHCSFVFERMGEVTVCPVCSSTYLHPATQPEQEAYRKGKEQEKRASGKDR